MKKHLFAILMVAACGKGDKAGDSKSAPPAGPAIDVAAVNAAVPADLKDKLVFEKQDFHEKHGRHDVTYTLAAPKGWKPQMEGMTMLHGDKDVVGFMTSLDLGSNCDGTCEPKDWAAVSEKVNFAQFEKDGWKLTKDDKQPTSRLLIAEKDDSTYVVYAWWQKGDRRYHTCTASLDKPVRTAGEAFAKACQAVNVSGED